MFSPMRRGCHRVNCLLTQAAVSCLPAWSACTSEECLQLTQWLPSRRLEESSPRNLTNPSTTEKDLKLLAFGVPHYETHSDDSIMKFTVDKPHSCTQFPNCFLYLTFIYEQIIKDYKPRKKGTQENRNYTGEKRQNY